MKITLDQATLAKAVINHLRGVGVQSDILQVDFRYTRVPYTVFAEVELAEAQVTKPAKTQVVVETSPIIVDEEPSPQSEPLVDPNSLDLEDPPAEEPPPELPAAPLFGGS
jgi:hypothetical protein